MVACEWGQEESEYRREGVQGAQGNLGRRSMFIVLISVVSWVCAYVRSIQVDASYLQLLLRRLYFSTAVNAFQGISGVYMCALHLITDS